VLVEEDRAVGRDQARRVEEVLDREVDPFFDLVGPREEDALGRGQSTAR
jgi:hypothetical protein